MRFLYSHQRCMNLYLNRTNRKQLQMRKWIHAMRSMRHLRGAPPSTHIKRTKLTWISDYTHYSKSFGAGVYHDRSQMPDPDYKFCFDVKKNRCTKDFVINFLGLELRQLILQVVPYTDLIQFDDSLSIKLKYLLPHYDDLKTLLQRLEEESLEDDVVLQELRLVCRDLLLDQAVFDGLDAELQFHILPTHRQDMQKWATQNLLDEIDKGIRALSGGTSLERPCFCRQSRKTQMEKIMEKLNRLDLKEIPMPKTHRNLIQALQNSREDQETPFNSLLGGLVSYGCQPLRAAAVALGILGEMKTSIKVMHHLKTEDPVKALRDNIGADFEIIDCGIIEWCNEGRYGTRKIEVINKTWDGSTPHDPKLMLKNVLTELGAMEQDCFKNKCIPKIREGNYDFIRDWFRSHRAARLDPKCLRVALECNQFRIFWLLVANGAVLNSSAVRLTFNPGEIRNDLLSAVTSGNIDRVQCLHLLMKCLWRSYDHGDRDLLAPDVRCPVAAAVAAGHVDIVQYLLQSGDIAIYGYSDLGHLLFLAHENGHQAVARLLIEHGAQLISGDDSPISQTSPPGNSFAVNTPISEHNFDQSDGYPSPSPSPSAHADKPLKPELGLQHDRYHNSLEFAEAVQERDHWMVTKRMDDDLNRRQSYLAAVTPSSGNEARMHIFAQLSDKERVREQGIESIRNLFNNKLPSQLYELMCLLQVATAMHLTGKAAKGAMGRLDRTVLDAPEQQIEKE
jgi:hypothetical protein